MQLFKYRTILFQGAHRTRIGCWVMLCETTHNPIQWSKLYVELYVLTRRLHSVDYILGGSCHCLWISSSNHLLIDKHLRFACCLRLYDKYICMNDCRILEDHSCHRAFSGHFGGCPWQTLPHAWAHAPTLSKWQKRDSCGGDIHRQITGHLSHTQTLMV